MRDGDNPEATTQTFQFDPKWISLCSLKEAPAVTPAHYLNNLVLNSIRIVSIRANGIRIVFGQKKEQVPSHAQDLQ